MSSEPTMPTKKMKRIEKQNRRKHPEISKQIVLLWEELRQKTVKPERKYELCDKIINLSKTVLTELIRHKVTARVYESVIEYGVDENRWTIFEILKKDLLDLCKAKYAHFAVISMLKHGIKEQRLSVFELLKGHIVELLQHAFACKVVEAAYNEFASAKQRGQMIQEFYGKTFALFTNGEEIKHLSDFTSNSSYDMSIINNLHKVMVPILRKQQADLTIVQQVLFEYINVLVQSRQTLGEDAAKPYVALLDEILELTNENLLTMCNTRMGTKVAIMIFHQCSTKLRKKIVSACKDVIVNICTSSDAHLFVLALVDQTDDTKMVNKYVIKPIMDKIDEISCNIHGRKIIQFLLNHRDNRFVSSFVTQILAQGDGNPHSKKESSVRAQEIVEFCRKPMLKWLENTIDDCLKYSNTLALVQSVMTKCLPVADDEKESYRNILIAITQHLDEPIDKDSSSSNAKRKAAEPKAVPKKKAKNFTGEFKSMEVDEDDTNNNEEQEDRTLIEGNIIETIGGQLLVKSLCKLEKENKIESFSAICQDKISLDTIKSFVWGNRAAFFLVFLFETGNKTVQDYLKVNLKSFQSSLAKSQLAGVKILFKHLFQ